MSLVVLLVILIAALVVGFICASAICLCIASTWEEGGAYLDEMCEREPGGQQTAGCESSFAMLEDPAPGQSRGSAGPESLPVDPLRVVTWHRSGSLTGNAKQRRIEQRCQARLAKKRAHGIGVV